VTASADKPLIIYRLRLRVIADHDDDGIRNLKQALRVLLRRFHLRISLERERP
jgi:hypothetical protein